MTSKSLKGIECPNCRSYLIVYADKIGLECKGCGAKYLGFEETGTIVKIPKSLIGKSKSLNEATEWHNIAEVRAKEQPNGKLAQAQPQSTKKKEKS